MLMAGSLQLLSIEITKRDLNHYCLAMKIPESLELIQYENENPEEMEADHRGLRIKSLVLLFIFLLPSLLIILELLTGQVSGWWNKANLPPLPNFKLVYF